MRKDLVNILACPDCKGHLKLYTFETQEKIVSNSKQEIVLEGILVCEKCSRWFPIIKGVPWLYPSNLRNKQIEKEFLRKHADKDIIKKILLQEVDS
ncbi:MAG: Trm112 family protein [Candidatus Njordarchaeales archaeon]